MRTPPQSRKARNADLAEIVLAVAREIRIREFAAKPEIALTPSHASVMRYVDAHPGTPAGEVADATGLLRSNLSSLVRQLESSGLIERRHDPQDGRGVLLHPTRKAATMRQQIREEWADMIERALADETSGKAGEHLEGGVDAATVLLGNIATKLVDERRRAGYRAGPRNF